MTASAPDPPKPIDPNTVIQAQEQANRVNRITPFGSQTYDAKGNLTTTLPEGTQTAFNNITELAGNKQQALQNPSGFGDLQNAMLTKALKGMEGGQGKSGGQQMPQLGTKSPGNEAWQAALSKIWGGQ